MTGMKTQTNRSCIFAASMTLGVILYALFRILLENSVLSAAPSFFIIQLIALAVAEMICRTLKLAPPKRLTVADMTRIAVLAAAASILFLVEIPVVAFYKLDLSNIPALLGAFSMGTVPGLIILGLKSAIGLLHSSSAGVGELADFVMGAALLIPASLIYHRNKTRKTALVGMAIGTVCTAVVGVLVNKFIMLPFYMGAFHMDMQGILGFANVGGVDSEWKLLLMITGPFNLLKGIVLSVVTGLIYKPLSPILHGKK